MMVLLSGKITREFLITGRDEVRAEVGLCSSDVVEKETDSMQRRRYC